MEISITNVHLDLGAGLRGAAAGPAAIHDAGIAEALRAQGHRIVAHHEIRQDDGSPAGTDLRARYLEGVGSACAQVADTVELSLRAGRFPLILGGDHSQAIGSVAGLIRYFDGQGKDLGVLWVDAHADMNTPATTRSGNLHGMPLAVLLGHGPDALTRLSSRSPALTPEHVVLFGVRDIDAAEAPLVQQSGVRVFTRSEIGKRGIDVCLAEAIALLSGAGAGIHLSYDLDVCDPSFAPGVTTPVPQGIGRSEALKVCEALAQSRRLVSMEIVELNPSLDVENQTGELAVRLVETALAVHPRPRAHSTVGLHASGQPADLGSVERERRIGIVAHSLYREMRAQGFAVVDIVSLASALLDELMCHIKEDNSSMGGAGQTLRKIMLPGARIHPRSVTE